MSNDANAFAAALPENSDDDDDLLSSLVDEDEDLAAAQEAFLNHEENIDLQALANEVYALLKQELKLKRQRLGR